MRLVLPELVTARYFSQRLLTSGEVVPVALAARPDLVPLPYDFETVEDIVPEVYGEWREVSHGYRAQLDAAGLAPIAFALARISEAHGNKPLALLGWEDPELGLRCHRHVFGDWWFERTRREVPELTNHGRRLARRDLHKQARPVRPRKKRRDERLRGPWPGGLSWPLDVAEVGAWLEARHWQFARTMPGNPHSYTHRAWNPEDEFYLIVLHLREFGRQEVFGGHLYTYLVANGCKHWTMGADLGSTILINNKPLNQEGEEAGVTTTASKEKRSMEQTLFGEVPA